MDQKACRLQAGWGHALSYWGTCGCHTWNPSGAPFAGSAVGAREGRQLLLGWNKELRVSACASGR